MLAIRDLLVVFVSGNRIPRFCLSIVSDKYVKFTSITGSRHSYLYESLKSSSIMHCSMGTRRAV